jgi:hypothetical protein
MGHHLIVRTNMRHTKPADGHWPGCAHRHILALVGIPAKAFDDQ